ncbi:Lactonase, 7-bladed beta-propeller [Polystyrenella longa]|uniref:Lactonase, 7-bladed beta-propeller n=1 Tax=Polystyrenella longa TaxID=2528007 RepID=A0A518CQY3_9PLAN|nr:WD40 repeat domain-containing protein [Polystyrenella longa]QDU81642.1 Lactonase, 7-bladed beta-propeller [Polystyrenella longa]
MYLNTRNGVLLTAAFISLGIVNGADAQLMLSGNENKIDVHTGAARVVPGSHPEAGSISILDFSQFPPRVEHLPGIENTVVGPPSNIAITPNHELALIASSLKIDPNDETQYAPDDLIHVLDLTTEPPQVIQEIHYGSQPSGMSITPDGKLAIVANRAAGSISILRIREKQVTPLTMIKVDEPEASVSDVAISPDGKTGLISVQEGCYLAQFTIDDEQVELNGRRFNTFGRPYRCVISPDGQFGLTAGAGSGDGAPNIDALTVIDLQADRPHTTDIVPIGAIPESIEVSPDGKLVAAVVMGSSNYDASNPLFKDDAEVVLLERNEDSYKVVQRLPLKRIPEGVAFTSDGKYLVVQCHLAKELFLYKVSGQRLEDTGYRIKVPGYASSLRAAP